MDTRFLAKWDQHNMDSKWKEKWRRELIRPADNEKAIVDGTKLPDPAPVPAMPTSFDPVMNTVNYIHDKGRGILTDVHLKQWKDYIEKWNPEALRKLFQCSECYKLLDGIKRARSALSRCPRARAGTTLPPTDKVQLSQCQRKHREAKHEYSQHVFQAKHERAEHWWTNGLSKRQYQDDKELVVLPGIVEHRARLYGTDGRMQEPVIGINITAIITKLNNNNNTNRFTNE